MTPVTQEEPVATAGHPHAFPALTLSGLVDLSLPIRDGGPSHPGDPICSVVRFKSLELDGVNLRALSIGSHQAYEVQAPAP